MRRLPGANPSGKDTGMRNCRLYDSCNANLCPEDPDIHKRIWFILEDVCNLPEHRQRPMVRRQRQLNRLAPESYLDKPLQAGWLIETARVRKVLTDAQSEALRRYAFKPTHMETQA
jgi:hypothetical protein